ncbi:MAG: DUF7079 family protein [Persicimonas sp.]
MNNRELQRRRPVWSALSDLFLDTEVRWFIPRIAKVLVESDYSEVELRRIWHCEVVPECAWNFLSIAGEWGAMPLDEGRLRRRATWFPGLMTLLWQIPGRLMREEFHQTLELRRRLRDYDPAWRDSYASVWKAFADIYVEEDLEDVFGLDNRIEHLVSSRLSREEMLETFDEDFRPVFRELLIGDEAAGEARRAANVVAIVERAIALRRNGK